MAAAERHHITGLGYVLTYIALIVLATVSLLLSFLHWTTGDLVVSLVIATIKALLVLWFFMHLAEQRFTNRMVLVAAVALFGILVALTAADVATRHTFPPAPRPTSSSDFYRR